MEISKSSVILVTGATGYVASHVIKVLLEQDYKVRSTVRSLANKSKYDFLYNIVPEKKDNLQLVEADLLRPETWGPALEGIEYVIHVASPFPVNNPRDENELIRPAVEGTLNVLNAAVAAGVKKVVLTSSVVSVFYGHEGKVTGPEDWSVEARCDAYSKSKVKAEKAAWDLWRKCEGKFELATVNPGFVLGPIYSSNGGKSEKTIGDMLAGKMPGIPELSFPIADVRDVAECHVKALLSPNSNGKRYICASESLWFKQIASILRREFKKYGYSVPKLNLGKTMLKFASLFDKRAKEVISIAGVERLVKNDLSVNELGMQYRKPDVTITEMAYSLIKAGVVKDRITPKRRNTK